MPPAIPIATYRLQLTADFDFDKAAAIVPYLKALGITHLYASPFMKARKGSTHGYDIVDHTRLNPELGGEAGFERLSQALRQHDLGLILDFVPNHVGVHFADNPWWLDVLEWGPASPHAVSFDIDWELLPYRARGGVLLPIIGSSYGEALERGEIELRYDAARRQFFRLVFRASAADRAGALRRDVAGDRAGSRRGNQRSRKIASSNSPRATRDCVIPTASEAPAFKAELRSIAGGAEIIARGLAAYRAGPDRAAQTLALHHLLERQHYKLGHWRLASSDINYRRFFDVNTLAGLRVEDAGTFAAIHRLVKQADRGRQAAGPAARSHRRPARSRAIFPAAAPPDPRRPRRRHRAVLHGDRKNPRRAREAARFAGVHGTTGYEWLNAIIQLLVDGNGLDPLDEVWRQISNRAPRLDPVLKDAKRRVLETLLTSEFTVLTRLLARIAAGHYSTRDYSADSLRQALELYVLHFPVYRTYLTSAGPTRARPRADHGDDRAGARRLVRRRRRHFRLSPRYADHGPDQAGPAAAQQAARAPLCAEGAAVHRSDDGEVAGGHRVLSLPPPARAERGRRRSRRQGALRRRLSRTDADARQANGRTA